MWQIRRICKHESRSENNYDPCSDLNTNLVVSCEGSIFFFTALTPAAGQWNSENVQPDAQWLGQALVVEHRYGAELAAAMRKAGLVLA